MAAIAAMSAATLAYRKAVSNSRKRKDLPGWMFEFQARLPNLSRTDGGGEEPENEEEIDEYEEKKARMLAPGAGNYNYFGWLIYKYITSQTAFEVFVLAWIVAVGIATGLDLEYLGNEQIYYDDDYTAPAWIRPFVNITMNVATFIFTTECVLKLLAEGTEPLRYFTHPEDGYFNTFDISIVVAGFILTELNNEMSVSLLRLLRLIRLLTFVKGIEQLRVIISGLVHGLQSVSYIVLLLILVIYICAIVTCLFLGENDPARFGTVAMSMLSLFQVSTLASWTSIAYTSWYGCENYLGDPYGAENPSVINTNAGMFQGFKCSRDRGVPVFVLLFFHFYIVLTSWVIMSLFIGVITMGMFESFENMKESRKKKRYKEKIAANTRGNSTSFRERNPDSDGTQLQILIREALKDERDEEEGLTQFQRYKLRLSKKCLLLAGKGWFSMLITTTICVVGVMIGVETDKYMRCERMEARNKDTECQRSLLATLVETLSQAIFSAEAAIKILGFGKAYFLDPWNKLDFFVVAVGFIEMSPLSFIFEAFPVVILRLLRLLRVFRLAKALPRLRSIVEALISGFSAVGWIVVLIAIFNWIAACACMVFLRKNDPFHFGSLVQSLFTMLRMETLDTWDQILGIAVYGCDEYPLGYDFTEEPHVKYVKLRCESPVAGGWLAAFLILFIIIFGSYILPTVLIGIVAISFDEATKRATNYREMMRKMQTVKDDADKNMPGFLSSKRMSILEALFAEMDADGEMALDLNEIVPFYKEVFKELFKVNDISRDTMESLFHVMDVDGDGDLGFAEMVVFIVVVKQLDNEVRKGTLASNGGLFETKEIKKKKPLVLESQLPMADYYNAITSKFLEGHELILSDSKDSVKKLLASYLEAVVERELSHAASALHLSISALVEYLNKPPENQRVLASTSKENAKEPKIVNPIRLDQHILSRPLGASLDTEVMNSLGDEDGTFDIDEVFSRLSKSNTALKPSIKPLQSLHEMLPGTSEPVSQSQENRTDIDALVSEHDEASASAVVDEVRDNNQQKQPLRHESRFHAQSGTSSGEYGSTLEKYKPRTLPDTPPRRRPPSIGGVAQPVSRRRSPSPYDTVTARSTQSLERNSSNQFSRVSGGRDFRRSVPRSTISSTATSSSSSSSSRLSLFAASGGRKEGRENIDSNLAWRRVIGCLHSDESKADAVEVEFQKRNGKCDVDELGQLLESLGCTLNRRQLKQFHQDLDINGDGDISFDEFIEVVTKKRDLVSKLENQAWSEITKRLDKSPNAARVIEERFSQADRDSNGELNTDELTELLAGFGVRLNSHMIAIFRDSIDQDRNGAISLDEFCDALDRFKTQNKRTL